MKERTFTFKFRGERADELAERFMAYFWDGGLDRARIFRRVWIRFR